jgi:protein-S-isoprenylcysteine O-methyltransferase Ste14
MTIVFRLVILVLLPVLAFLGHGDQLLRRLKGEAPAAGVGGRTGHASVYVWFFCYTALIVLAAGRMFLGTEPGVLAAAGMLILAAGVGLRRLALPRIGEYFDEFILVKKGHRVVDSGVYGLCRHPLYKGLVLELLGMTLVSAHFSAWILLGIGLVYFFVRGVQEERVLAETLGDPYREYLARVPSVLDLLPRTWRPYAPPRSRSSPPDPE